MAPDHGVSSCNSDGIAEAPAGSDCVASPTGWQTRVPRRMPPRLGGCEIQLHLRKILCFKIKFITSSLHPDPGTIDEQPHWYWLQDNSGGLTSLPLVSNHNSDSQPNGKGGNSNISSNQS